MKLEQMESMEAHHNTVCDESKPMDERLSALISLEKESGILSPSSTDKDVLFYVEVMNAIF